MSDVPISSRARAVGESATLAITAKAAALQAQGRDVVSLGAGEPDFSTPEPVGAAGIEAIRSGQTRYTAASGTLQLRKAAADWFRRSCGLEYSPQEVMATAGAKPALHIALMSLLEPGDRVLLPAPCWVSYPDLVRVAGGEPVDMAPVPDQGHVHSGEQVIAAAKATGAKGIIINYPNNPSGAVPERRQMEEIVAAAADRGMWILSDEIYSKLTYDGFDHVSPASVPGGRERTVVVNGGTKSHSLTGWRIGFLAGSEEFVAACGRIQSQVIGNPSSISQAAGLAACTLDLDEELERRQQAYDERRKFLVEAIDGIAGLQLEPPRGAFYALVDARSWCEQLGCDDVELASRLLEEQLLAVVPGSAFGIPGFVRLSYAAAMDELRVAMQRLRAFGAGL